MVDRAIFLVGGESSRFRGIVEQKCLLRIAGQTLIERQIVQCANLGIEEFVFVVGAASHGVWLEAGRAIEECGIPAKAWSVVYSRDYTTVGTGGALELCRGVMVDGISLILEGDIVVQRLHSPYDHTHTWFVVDSSRDRGSYVLVNDKCIATGYEIFKPVTTVLGRRSAGIFASVGLLPLGGQLIDDAFSSAAAQIIVINGKYWHEIDTISDFEEAKRKFTEPVRFQVDPALI